MGLLRIPGYLRSLFTKVSRWYGSSQDSRVFEESFHQSISMVWVFSGFQGIEESFHQGISMVWVFSGIELVHFPSMEAVAPAPEESSKCFRNALINCLKSLGLLTNNPTIHFPPPPNKK